MLQIVKQPWLSEWPHTTQETSDLKLARIFVYSVFLWRKCPLFSKICSNNTFFFNSKKQTNNPAASLPDWNIFKSLSLFNCVWRGWGDEGKKVAWISFWWSISVCQVFARHCVKRSLPECAYRLQEQDTENLELESRNGMRLVASSIMVLGNRSGGIYHCQGSLWRKWHTIQKAFELLHCHQVPVKPLGKVCLPHFDGQTK